MTVRELNRALELQDPNTIVMVSSDEEGNSVSPMSDLMDVGDIGQEHKWTVDGEQVVYRAGEDFQCFDFEKNKGKRYIILYPTL